MRVIEGSFRPADSSRALARPAPEPVQWEYVNIPPNRWEEVEKIYQSAQQWQTTPKPPADTYPVWLAIPQGICMVLLSWMFFHAMGTLLYGAIFEMMPLFAWKILFIELLLLITIGLPTIIASAIYEEHRHAR